MLKPILTLSFVVLASQSFAQGIDTEAMSNSSSGVYIGGTTVSDNTPNVMASPNNNTAPCSVGGGFGIAGAGMGFSIGTGRVNKDCQIMQEAKALQSLLGNRAAIAHLCKHDKTIQATLVDLGLCKVVKRK